MVTNATDIMFNKKKKYNNIISTLSIDERSPF